jgi:hypothetical protein
MLANAGAQKEKLKCRGGLECGQTRASESLCASSKFNSHSKMTSVDYTPVLLAQITDLQQRLTKMEAEVARLSGRGAGSAATATEAPPAPARTGFPLRTSVPLRSNAPEYQPRGEGRYEQRGSRPDGRIARGPPMDRPGATLERPSRPSGGAAGGRPKPRVAPTDGGSTGPRPTMSLSDVLKADEEVTMEVRTGKDAEGNDTRATIMATFDGTDLAVKECELVESLVGMKSSKPGEILYKFIDELKAGDHIKRTFTIAPWRLCFVERDGVRKSLEELRSTVATA